MDSPTAVVAKKEKKERKVKVVSTEETDAEPSTSTASPEKKRKRAVEGELEVVAAESIAMDVDSVPAVTEESEAPEAGLELDEVEELEALSHKERRKRKRMSLQQPAPGASTSAPRVALPAQSQALHKSVVEKPRVRSQFCVWVGNMRFSTTVAMINEFFEAAGEVTRVHMTDGVRKGENKG